MPNETAEFVAVGNSWGLLGGSIYSKYSSSFESSKASNGYQKLPSGLIIQWGSLSWNTENSGQILFPTVFPNTCVSVVANGMYDNGSVAVLACNTSYFYCSSLDTALNTVGTKAYNRIAIGY